ncbi:MAG TPA: tRNA-guanine transglycosylase, partial [Nitrososphaera sp.]|nr:tRNA-guanine transglycosylase [Nitrososphaera sp.]
SDLVEHSARALDEMGFGFLALGSPVELMEAYEFAKLVQMIATAKRTISPGKPIHLFGAGHPLTISLAVALGCDTFDSASYMLYAKDGRYMHPSGTARVDELSYLPCQCAVCSSWSASDMRSAAYEERTVAIAKHNLYVLKSEVDSVKQAIIDGRLWEYCMQKARAHPKLMEAMRLFPGLEFLSYGTPAFKDKALFLYEPIDQFRPEAKRFREMVEQRFRSRKKRLVLCAEGEIHPFYATRLYSQLRKRYPEGQICCYSPYLGVIPSEISDIFPAAHNVATRGLWDASEFPSLTDSLRSFMRNNSFDTVTVVASSGDDKILDVIKNCVPPETAVELATD